VGRHPNLCERNRPPPLRVDRARTPRHLAKRRHCARRALLYPAQRAQAVWKDSPRSPPRATQQPRARRDRLLLPRLGTRLLFPALGGGGGRRRGAYGYLNLPTGAAASGISARVRRPNPARHLRPPSHLRDLGTHPTSRARDLRARRYMGDSVRTIERYYGISPREQRPERGRNSTPVRAGSDL
jgi:hypothetical protein